MLGVSVSRLQILLHTRDDPELAYFVPWGILHVFPQHSQIHCLEFAAVASIHVFSASGCGQLWNHQRTLRLLYALHVHAWCGISCLTQEKKYSTAYILLEVFMQITLINLVMVVIGYPFIYFGVLSDLSLVSYGMQPVLYYFIWCKVAQNPD